MTTFFKKLEDNTFDFFNSSAKKKFDIEELELNEMYSISDLRFLYRYTGR